MPFFDFECKKCGNVKTEMMKWSEDMHEHIDKCECGEKEYKRLITHDQMGNIFKFLLVSTYRLTND